MRLINLLFIKLAVIICLSSCRETVKNSSKSIDNIIRLDDAIENPQEVLLSSLVDSITLIPLETNPDILVDGKPRFSFCEQYIEVDTRLFDWEGNFVRKIGTHGRGPGEDTHVCPQIKYKEGEFWSRGSKLIGYDSLGKYDGKEWHFFKHTKDRPLGAGRNFFDFEFVGDKIVMYQFPDSLYWINKQFELTSGELVIKNDHYQKECGSFTGINRYFSTFKDKVIFYNFFNDTIYNVELDRITPRYVMQFPNSKLPEEFFPHKSGPFMNKAMRAWYSGGFNSLEEFKLSDGKVRVFTLDETQNYLFFIYRREYFWGKLRGKKNPGYQLAFYNKSTGKTVALKGNSFSNNIISGLEFLPLWGAFNEKLIASINSYELIQFVNDKQERGEQVNEKLMSTVKQLEVNDNPVLIVAHLKK